MDKNNFWKRVEAGDVSNNPYFKVEPVADRGSEDTSVHNVPNHNTPSGRYEITDYFKASGGLKILGPCPSCMLELGLGALVVEAASVLSRRRCGIEQGGGACQREPEERRSCLCLLEIRRGRSHTWSCVQNRHRVLQAFGSLKYKIEIGAGDPTRS